MSTGSLKFPLPGGDLVFSGVEDGNPFGLYGMTEPAQVARIVYASESPDVSGSLAIQAVWQQANLSAVVGITGANQSDLEVKKGQLRAALARLSFTVVTEVNGHEQSWLADFGSMQPTDEIDVVDLASFQAFYSVTIPVQPLGA